MTVVLSLVPAAVFVLGFVANFATPAKHVLRGRYISRPLTRLLGRPRALILRVFLALALLPLLVGWLLGAPFRTAYLTDLLLLSLWRIDDWLTGGDDDRDHKASESLRRRFEGALRPISYDTSTGAGA